MRPPSAFRLSAALTRARTADPTLFVLFTAIENSFLRIRWITLILQLFMLMMLVESLVLRKSGSSPLRARLANQKGHP